MNALDALTFTDSLWLLPAAAALHVMEELPRFPAWANQTLGGGGGKLSYTRAKFVWENLVLFAVLIAAVVMTRWLPAASIGGRAGLMLSLGAAAGLFLNCPFHAWYTLRTGTYSPGTVTACLLFVPIPALVVWKAAAGGLLTPLVVGVAAVLGVGLLPLVVTLVHAAIDRGLTLRSALRYAAMAVVPPVVMSLLNAVFSEAVASTVTAVAGTVALLALGLKLLRKVLVKGQR